MFTTILQTVLAPSPALAQGFGAPAYIQTSAPIAFLAFILLAFFLSRAWIGIMNLSLLDTEKLSSIEKRKPYMPSIVTIIGAVGCTALIVQFVLQLSGGIVPFDGPNVLRNIVVILGAATAMWLVGYFMWPYKSQRYFFAVIIGTILTFTLLACKEAIIGSANQNPFAMALTLVAIVIVWNMLFGPWSSHVKATILGTFIVWIGIHLIFKQPVEQRFAYLLTIAIAAIPAGIWCLLFARYHRQKWSRVVMMLFAGMLSTAPILLYDVMVRNGVELNFFLFRIVPESFIGTSNSFVSSSVVGVTSVQTKVLASLVSFILVGLIEEVSKFWVLKHGGKNEFTSIDDVLQLAIMVAIGFAFAENILNPAYFLAFVDTYLLASTGPDWFGFLGNVLGRSVLTNMVHIVATGILGYFYGLVLFARPYLDDAHKEGKKLRILHALQAIFHTSEKRMFKSEMLFVGFLISIVLHGAFNFLVSLPSILPGNPQTLGDIFGPATPGFIAGISLLMLPSLLYVVGGFWVLNILFYKRQSMKERGMLIETESFVQVHTTA